MLDPFYLIALSGSTGSGAAALPLFPPGVPPPALGAGSRSGNSTPEINSGGGGGSGTPPNGAVGVSRYSRVERDREADGAGRGGRLVLLTYSRLPL